MQLPVSIVKNKESRQGKSSLFYINLFTHTEGVAYIGRWCPGVPRKALIKAQAEKDSRKGEYKTEKQYLNGQFKINVIWCLMLKQVLEEIHIRKTEDAVKELNIWLTIANTNSGPSLDTSHILPQITSDHLLHESLLRIPAWNICNLTEEPFKNIALCLTFCPGPL